MHCTILKKLEVKNNSNLEVNGFQKLITPFPQFCPLALDAIQKAYLYFSSSYNHPQMSWYVIIQHLKPIPTITVKD
jgi:hypothetical protein